MRNKTPRRTFANQKVKKPTDSLSTTYTKNCKGKLTKSKQAKRLTKKGKPFNITLT